MSASIDRVAPSQMERPRGSALLLRAYDSCDGAGASTLSFWCSRRPEEERLERREAAGWVPPLPLPHYFEPLLFESSNARKPSAPPPARRPDQETLVRCHGPRCHSTNVLVIVRPYPSLQLRMSATFKVLSTLPFCNFSSPTKSSIEDASFTVAIDLSPS